MKLTEAKKNIEKGISLLNPTRIPNQIFSFEQEVHLMNYMVTALKMHHGLTTVEVRKLAYQYGSILKLPMPLNWKTNCQARPDWLYGFVRIFKLY